MKLYFNTLALCFLFSSFLYAQINYQNENFNYTPTTPEAASLGKFIETPVSYYSGIPNISVPIITMTEGELSIPIVLNYHAGGIRIEETASWVGTGWNLSAGGSITRAVRGSADDGVGGYFNASSNTVANFLNQTSSGTVINLIDQAIENSIDYQPDVFHYNFPGYSGSFFISQSGEVISMPHTDISIVSVKDSYNKIIGWVLKTPQGNTYYFGKSKDGARTANERLLSSVALGGGKNHSNGYVTGWNLLDVDNFTTKKSIKLSYVQNIYDTCSRSGQERYVNGHGEIGIPVNGIRPIIYYDNLIQSSKISSIETSNGKLEFIKEISQRIDQPNDYALKEIVLKDKINVELKRFKLTYENRGQIVTSIPVPCSGNERYYRFFLKNIQEFSESQSINPYIFEYNIQNLPEKFSYAQDFWGFYNGKTGNQNLIPSVTVRGVRYTGADKASDSNFSKAGILEKIVYPTGGSSEYLFEGNTISQLAFATDIAPRSQHTITTINTTKVLQSNPFFYSESFTITNGQYLEDIITIDVNFPCDVTQRTCGIDFILRKSDNSINENLYTDTTLTLTPGTYYIEGSLSQDDFGNYPDFTIRLYGEQIDIGSLTTDGLNFDVGGLRIKNIKKKDSDGSLAFERTYEYENFSGTPGTSSGGITSTPFFVEMEAPMGVGIVGGVYTNAIADVISSSSNSPFTSSQSNYVGYSNVMEYFGTPQNNNGKIEYEYSFSLDDDSGLGYSDLPNTGGLLQGNKFPPRVSLEWLRGSLLEQRIFKNEGSYSLLKKTKNVYTYYRNSNNIFNKNIIGIKTGRRNDVRTYKSYNTLSEWYKLDYSVIIDFSDGNEVVTTTEYIYNENEQKHVMPIEVKTINNPSEEYTTKIYYPQDLTNPTTSETVLINDFKIGIPIKKEILKNALLLSREYTIYNNTKWADLNLPEFVQTSKGNNTLEDRITYYNYDNEGNPLEVSKANDTHISYIWGYNKQYPIAKIENATYSQVQSHVSNLQSLSNSDSDLTSEKNLRNALNGLRSDPALSNSLVTTYTYDPLIGITSITDPRGYTIYYEYDELNRLQQVKDAAGNILSKNEYHYKDQ